MRELSNSVARELLVEIEKIPILDPHSHIDPHRAASRSFDDILGYHYYTELAHSAGMDQGPLAAGVPALERARAIARYLPALENTAQYGWLLEIARTFFDFTGDAITPRNIDALFESAAQKTAQANWEQEVIRRTRLEKVFLTNEFDDPLDGFDTERYVPCLRTDDLVFRLGDPGVVRRLERAAGMDVRGAESLVAAIEQRFRHFTRRGARACAISLPPDFAPLRPDRAGIDTVLKLVLARHKTTGTAPADRTDHAADNLALARFVFWTLAEFCGEFRLPFDLMIGVNRRVYAGGVFQGQDLFDQRTSLVQYRELFNAFPQVLFPVSVLSSAQNQELVSHAWIFPNVFAHGHWWYSNVPAYIEPDLAARLDAVPATKQIGYYSDAYRLEFILPKFNMYRRALARVLAREFVAERGWSVDRAVALARQILYDNVQRVFGV